MTSSASSENPSHTVRHIPERHRFEIDKGTQDPAVLTYRVEKDRVVFDHTYVPDSMRGMGLAAILVNAALAEARRLGWKVDPTCSYVATYMKRHSETHDLLFKP